jgi:ribosomal protein S18 acetylase RimI-like enzyme
MQIDIRRITTRDNLDQLAKGVIGSEWGSDNEMHDYSVAALTDYVGRSDRALIVAYAGDKPVGLLLATKIFNPYGRYWLYIDEVDVHPAYRRQSIGRRMMERALQLAKEWGLKEAWLGTEVDNEPAIGYTSHLAPPKSKKPLAIHSLLINPL